MIAAFWIYTIIWVGALITIYYLWNVGLNLKIIVTIPFIVFTPAITDLFQSYENFVEQLRGQGNLK